MSNEILKSNTVINSMDDAERAANAMAKSGFFADTKSAAQAVVKILAGQELGFGPFASMTGVNIIQNKPVLSANLMAAAVKRGGKYNYRVVIMTDVEVELEFMENGQPVGKSKFTMKDAEKAGLTNKDNWKKWPRNMLFARALANGQKWFAPDVFNGATVYTPDELGAEVDEDGNAVNVPSLENPDPIDDNSWTIWESLVKRADAQNIEHANPNRETTTKSELRTAYHELEGFVKQAEQQGNVQ